MDLRETLKPKTPSYSFMTFLSRVLFPAPDGPLNTTGLGPAIAVREAEKYRAGSEKQVAEDGWLKHPWKSSNTSHHRTKFVSTHTEFSDVQQRNMFRQASLKWHKYESAVFKELISKLR